MSELLVERDGPTLILTLKRPDKMNALSATLVEALFEQVAEAGRAGIRLLVLRHCRRYMSGHGSKRARKAYLILRISICSI